MPTGYTSDIADGTITDFPTFACRCARNFGALILMRDDPSDKPIPERFEPSQRHNERLEATRTELSKIEKATPDEIAAMAKAAYDERLASVRKMNDDKQRQKRRYETMLAKVYLWEPPTPDHVGMKNFMVQQLTESIQWDCDKPYEEPEQITAEKWKAQKLASLNHDIEYHAKHQAEENERTEQRNEWIRQLRESLEETPADAMLAQRTK